MCPECFASAAMIVAGMFSAGGITTLMVKNLRGRKDASYASTNQTHNKGEENERD